MAAKVEKPADYKINKLQIAKQLRKTLFLEIILVVTLYLILFLAINYIIQRQSRVERMIVSRFTLASQIQTLERYLLQDINLERGYRLANSDVQFQALVNNSDEFSQLLDDTNKRLANLPTGEAIHLTEEKALAQHVRDVHNKLTADLTKYIGKPIAKGDHAQLIANLKTSDDRGKLESEINSLEQQGVNSVNEWRLMVEKDTERLNELLGGYQLARTWALIIQALLVLLGLIILNYRYVLPSFEKVLRRLIYQNEQFRRIDEVKTEFLSTTSHQLRTPLTVIRWTISVLAKKIGGDTATEKLVEQAKGNIDTLIKLVSTLLNVSRLEQGRLEYHLEPTDLIPMIDRAFETAKEIARTKQVTLIKEYQVDSAPSMVDPSLMKEAIQNLVDNAIHYNKPGGSVTVTIGQAQGSKWSIKVADTGQGISPEDMHDLFTKFYRGSQAKKSRPDGSGLGLYFTKEIIENHSGQINLDSEVGKGTVVYVTIPVAQYAPKHVKRQIIAPAAADGAPSTVPSVSPAGPPFGVSQPISQVGNQLGGFAMTQPQSDQPVSTPVDQVPQSAQPTPLPVQPVAPVPIATAPLVPTPPSPPTNTPIVQTQGLAGAQPLQPITTIVINTGPNVATPSVSQSFMPAQSPAQPVIQAQPAIQPVEQPAPPSAPQAIPQPSTPSTGLPGPTLSLPPEQLASPELPAFPATSFPATPSTNSRPNPATSGPEPRVLFTAQPPLGVPSPQPQPGAITSPVEPTISQPKEPDKPSSALFTDTI